MPLTPIDIPPGVVFGESDYASQGRWIRSDRIRFRDKFPEKIGGCAKEILSPLTGVCRGMLGWRDNSGNRRKAFGTHRKLQTLYSGALYDLTPVTASGTLANPFSTTSGSAIVNVNDTAHGLAVVDAVIFSGAAAVGGITIDGEYTVTAVVDADNYTITHSAPASGTAGPGGGAAVAYSYLLTIGRADDGEGAGYGAGGYGLGPYGIGIAGGIPTPARTWTLDTYGENLIACPRNGGVYTWDPPIGTPATRAVALTGAPAACTGILVTDQRHTFAYGVTTVAAGSGFTGSKMFVQWADADDNTDWVPSDTNTANGRALQGGNELVGHVKVTRDQFLLCSDTHAFVFQYNGGDFVYDSKRLSDNSGMIGPKASCAFNNIGYWMSRDHLYMYDGAQRSMPNLADIHDAIFGNINLAQRNKCFLAINEENSEVWVFWPSSNSSEVDSYAIYCTLTGAWAVGTWARTAWIERGLFESPTATDPDGYIISHESGEDDDGAEMGDYIESAPGDTQAGAVNLVGDEIIPDMSDLTGTVEFTVLTKDKPNDTVVENGPYDVTTATTQIDPDPRIDGRQFALKIASTGLGSHWRMGRPRINLRPRGKRR